MEAAAREFQTQVESVNEEKHLIEERNKIRLGLNPDRNAMSQANLESIAIDKYNLWHDVLEGVVHYTDGALDRFLSGEWKRRLVELRAEAAALKKDLPPQYPFLQTLQDAANPHDIHVAIRGDVNNPGEPAGRHLPSILCEELRSPSPGAAGGWNCGRDRQRAESADGRVMANRIWLHVSGGACGDASNFGTARAPTN
jgi:hypothetical protein